MNTQEFPLPWPAIKARLSSETIGWIAFCVMVLSSGTYYSFAKVLSSTLSPFTVVLLSESLTATFVLLSFGLFPAIRSFLRLSSEKRLALLGVGLASGICAPAMLFSGLRITSAVNATLFGDTEPLFLLILAVLLLHEKLRWHHILAKLLIIMGIACIALRGFSEGFVFHPGDAFLILAGLFYGFGDLLFRKYLHNVHTSTVILGRSTIAISGALTLSLLLPSIGTFAEARALPLQLLGVLIGFAFISRFLNLFSFYQSLERLPVGTLSVFSNLNVISSMIFARLYLGETIQGYQIVGGMFIIGGAVLLELLGGHHRSRTQHIAHLKQRQAYRV